MARRSIILALLTVGAACAPPPLRLPSGSGAPLADASPMLAEATGTCDRIRSITAEMGLSGRVGRVKLRGRLQAGFAEPDALRVEGIAPFGAPVFVLAGRGGQATLWLPRDDRVLERADPAALLDALAGLDVGPANLRRWLTGCPAEGFTPAGAKRFGADWVRVTAQDGGVVWLRHTDRWRLLEQVAGPLIVELTDYAAAGPSRVRFRHEDGGDSPSLDVRLALDQVETNVTLGPEAFEVEVSPSAQPITIEELRESGPLRDAAGGR